MKKLAFTCFLVLINITQAFASEVEHQQSAGHEEASGGLPQLDPSSFESQSFWLVVIFVGLYVIFSKISLPKISRTVEDRAERIKSDLDSAEGLKEEIAAVQEDYELKLKDARTQSSDVFKNIEEELKTKSNEQTKDFQDRSHEKVIELEGNIEKARKTAMEDMTQVAADIATQAAEKIIGVRADAQSARDVVKSINKAA